jgi:hypothetical protein
MPRKQIRRSSNLRTGTYELLAELARRRGVPMSRIVESIVNGALDRAGASVVAEAKSALATPERAYPVEICDPVNG